MKKRLCMLLIAALMMLAGCGRKAEEAAPEEPATIALPDGGQEILFEDGSEPIGADEAALRKAYPEVFMLDASKGLDVIVWQMAGELYSFGILEHAETQRDWLDPALMQLKGFSADEMRTVLAAYGVNEADVTIVPWQNPISSYLPDYLIVRTGEDPEAKRQAYIDGVRAILFGDRS
jgi:hypothetical protein